MKLNSLQAVAKTAFFLTMFAGLILGSACSGIKEKTDATDDVPEEQISEAEDTVSLSTLDMLIRENPTNASLFSRRARIHAAKGDTDEGLNDMAIALSLDSLEPAYYIQQAEYFVISGRPNDAKSILTRGQNQFPRNPDLKLKMAEVYFYLQEYARSKMLLDDVKAIDENIAQIYFLNGLISVENGDTISGIRFMQTAINKDPDFYAGYIQTGRLYSGQGDDLAIQYFRSAIELEPNSYEAHYHLGLYYQEHGFLDEAHSEYDYIIANIDSTIANPFYNKGFIELIYKGNFKEAINWFTKTIEKEPNYPEAWYNRGLSHELDGQYKKARTDYDESLKLSPNYPLAIKGLNRLDQNKPIKVTDL